VTLSGEDDAIPRLDFALGNASPVPPPVPLAAEALRSAA